MGLDPCLRGYDDPRRDFEDRTSKARPRRRTRRCNSRIIRGLVGSELSVKALREANADILRVELELLIMSSSTRLEPHHQHRNRSRGRIRYRYGHSNGGNGQYIGRGPFVASRKITRLTMFDLLRTSFSGWSVSWSPQTHASAPAGPFKNGRMISLQ